jgi:hypothetical protein
MPSGRNFVLTETGIGYPLGAPDQMLACRAALVSPTDLPDVRFRA